jgi:3-oxoacyl-[acyl-carrier protein] reductase
MNKLHGKRALVTAGAQGIGLAISRQLLAAGCDVFVHYRSSVDAARDLEGEAMALGRRYAHFAADLTVAAECDRLVNEAVAFLGGLDVLINNAGSLVARNHWPKAMTHSGPGYGLSDSMRHYAGRRAHHRGGKTGRRNIIRLIAGRRGGAAGALAYSTAKGAILTFTRGLASELSSQGVRVNALAPGLILGTYFHNTHTKPEAAAGIVAGIPLGRAGNADDVARAAVFFASEYDGFITGATLDINGGVYVA